MVTNYRDRVCDDKFWTEAQTEYGVQLGSWENGVSCKVELPDASASYGLNYRVTILSRWGSDRVVFQKAYVTKFGAYHGAKHNLEKARHEALRLATMDMDGLSEAIKELSVAP
jgi:hypothetical protein